MGIDIGLVDRFVGGDMAAFEAIYEITRPLVYRTAFQMTGNHQEVEDIIHDTYIKAFTKRHTYNHSASLPTWIHAIGVNQTLNMIKRKKRETDLVLQDMSCPYRPDLAVKTEESELVRRILNHITPDYRMCIVLKDIEAFSYEDIATLLGISIGTVRSRLNRGRRQFEAIVAAWKRKGLL